MFFVRRTLVFVTVASCGALFSQAPEFTQQYRQRLGGAIDELTIIIQNFDEQANHEGLDRQGALNVYAASREEFLRRQGDALRRSFARYQSLSDQSQDLSAASPILRPLLVAQRPDRTIVANSWRDFGPALPVSVAGAVWAGFGMLAGMIAAAGMGALAAMAGKFSRRPVETVSAGLSGRALQ